MPKIRWAMQTWVQNKALGLPGPPAVQAQKGETLDVDEKTLKAIEARYGKAAFEIVAPPATKAADSKKGKGNA